MPEELPEEFPLYNCGQFGLVLAYERSGSGFESSCSHLNYILGNQKARQEAVSRGDDMQANIWKLLNNANFGSDRRDNSQNKSLQLIYHEQAEIKFINKYGGYESTNCFLNLVNLIANVQKKYTNIEGLAEDEWPLHKT